MDASEFEQPGLAWRVDLCNVEGSGEPPDGLLVLTLDGPIPTERRRELGSERTVARGPAPLEGSPHVGHLEA